MSETSDPRCPECGGPIGRTATYCMHCSADLTEERSAADADGDGTWDRTGPSVPSGSVDSAGVDPTSGAGGADRLLAPDGLVDDALTVLVGIAGGIVVGLVGTVVLLVATGSGWAVVFGVAAWLVATAYLVRRRTVQAAVAESGYAVAAVLLSVPVIALSPVVEVDGGLEERGGLFVVLLIGVVVPAAVAAAIGWLAGRFVGGSDGEG